MNDFAPSSSPISTRGLSKTYRIGFWLSRKVRALQGLDLTIAAGQVYGLLGPNGAGKSTTIKILMNLVRPTSGEAALFGLQPSDRRARRFVGFLPENPAPYEYLTGSEFVTLAGELGGLAGDELRRRAAEVIGMVGMDRAARLQIRRYSKGMVQRIALAQALVARPKLLILDEPTSGLDPVGRRQMRDLILQERERGTTVLFCTHIIPDVEALCDRVAVLVSGRLVREGSVNELLTASTSQTEVMFEGISAETLQGFGDLGHCQRLENRVLVRGTDAQIQTLLRKAIEAGGRVTYLQPVRSSLEDLFLKTLEESGRTSTGADLLGSEIQ